MIVKMENATRAWLNISILHNSDGDFGKHQFILTNPATAIVCLLIRCIASLSGTAGNVLTILAILTHKKIRNEKSVFFVNLAVSDLYVTVVADPLSMVGKWRLLFLPFLFYFLSLCQYENSRAYLTG